jgi:hypothetical protein
VVVSTSSLGARISWRARWISGRSVAGSHSRIVLSCFGGGTLARARSVSRFTCVDSSDICTVVGTVSIQIEHNWGPDPECSVLAWFNTKMR